MASPLLWTPPENHHLHLMTTIIIFEFACSLDSDTRPLGDAAQVWDQVLNSISELPGWKSTKWGPQSDDKHRVVVIIGA